MPTFDWRTDVRELDEAPFVVFEAERRPSRWRIGLEIIVAFGLVAFFTYQQVNRWLERVAANVRESPRAAFVVWQTAVMAQDQELFNDLIWQNKQDWLAAQQTLFAQNLIFDRPMLGLKAVGEPVLTAVDLAPNLTSARVTFAQDYQSPNYPVTQLQQTATFQLHNDRWLLSPPDGRFWGSWHIDEKDYATLVYTERDAVIGGRLAMDLDQLVAQSCEQLACPDGFRLWIPLRTDPESLIELTDWQTMVQSGRNIPLPSPTLVGVPPDEAGYQALLRGYGRWVVAAVFTRHLPWRCCQHKLFYQALLEEQLEEMGLGEGGLTTADYDTMLTYHFDIAQLSEWWQDNDDNAVARWQIEAFMDFLVAKSAVPTPQLLAQLMTADTFRQWAEWAVAPEPLLEIELRNEWLQFAYEKTSMRGRERPLLPRNQLLCVSREGLYRYDLVTATWTREMSLPEKAIMLISPYEAGTILYEQVNDVTAGQSWTIIPQSDETKVIDFDVPLFPVYLADNAPGGTSLVANALGQSGAPLVLLDLANCTTYNCKTIQLPSVPVWSPDGRHTLLTLAAAPPPFYILLGNELGYVARDVGEGILPFWLDDHTFGYWHHGLPTAVVLADIADPTTIQPILTAADLRAALPLADSYAVRQIHANPIAPRWLFIEAVPPDLQSQIIFAFDRETGEVSARLQIEARERFMAFQFSPDGRYFTLTTHATHDPIGANWMMYLHHIDRNETEKIAVRPLPYAAEYSTQWSADGRWLLKADSGVLQLMVPDEDYFELVIYNGGRCTSSAWVQPSP